MIFIIVIFMVFDFYRGCNIIVEEEKWVLSAEILFYVQEAVK